MFNTGSVNVGIDASKLTEEEFQQLEKHLEQFKEEAQMVSKGSA